MEEELVLLLTIQVKQSVAIPPKVIWTVTGAGTADRNINIFTSVSNHAVKKLWYSVSTIWCWVKIT